MGYVWFRAEFRGSYASLPLPLALHVFSVRAHQWRAGLGLRAEYSGRY
jgi:hypothetical protein